MSNTVRDAADFDLVAALQSYIRPDVTVTVHLDAVIAEQIEAEKAKLAAATTAQRKTIKARIDDLQAARAKTAVTFVVGRSDTLSLIEAGSAIPATDAVQEGTNGRAYQGLVALVARQTRSLTMPDGKVAQGPLEWAQAKALFRAMSGEQWTRLTDAITDGDAEGEAVDPTDSREPSGDSPTSSTD